MKSLSDHTNKVIKTLGDFRNIWQKSESRKEYLSKLQYFIMTNYGYNKFFTEALFKIFPESEIIEMLEVSNATRPISIRTNRIKTRRKELVLRLLNRGINVDPQGKWSNIGLLIYESTQPLVSTPEYMAGYFAIQSSSSFLPCVSLAVQTNETVVDVISCTGVKSCYLSALMQNTGIIFVNEVTTSFLVTISLNMQRLGVINSILCSYNYWNSIKLYRLNLIL
jgi:ribosomal RNA methyltransferase Nop2